MALPILLLGGGGQGGLARAFFSRRLGEKNGKGRNAGVELAMGMRFTPEFDGGVKAVFEAGFCDEFPIVTLAPLLCLAGGEGGSGNDALLGIGGPMSPVFGGSACWRGPVRLFRSRLYPAAPSSGELRREKSIRSAWIGAERTIPDGLYGSTRKGLACQFELSSMRKTQFASNRSRRTQAITTPHGGGVGQRFLGLWEGSGTDGSGTSVGLSRRNGEDSFLRDTSLVRIGKPLVRGYSYRVRVARGGGKRPSGTWRARHRRGEKYIFCKLSYGYSRAGFSSVLHFLLGRGYLPT